MKTRGGSGRAPVAGVEASLLIDTGIEMIARAVRKDGMGRLEEALTLYREGIDLLLRGARGEPTVSRRQTLLREVNEHMSRAEAIKAALAPPALPDPPTPRGLAESQRRGKGRRIGEARPSPSASDVWGSARGGSRGSSSAEDGGGRDTAASRRRRATNKRNQPTLPPKAGGIVSGGMGGSGATNTGSGGSRGSVAGGGSSGGLVSKDATATTELEDKIMADMLDGSPGVMWDSIAGLEYAKQTLQETVILPNLRPDLYTGLRAPSKGVLLYGPPGTGKTMLAKAVATESGYSFFSISASSLTSKWVGEGEKMVKALFSAARKNQPAVIFIDEVDSVLSARGEGEHEASRRLKTEFLVQLDGIGSEGGNRDGGLPETEERLLVLAATNLPQELDEAALRRLSRRVYVPLPDPPARRGLLLRLLGQVDNKADLKGDDLASLVSMTEGYSGSDLKELCKEAAMYPLRDLGSKVRTVAKADIRAIGLNDFKQAITRVRPSVSRKTIEKYEEWERSLSGGL